MPLVELAFPISGRSLPENNGYSLFAAVSHALKGHVSDGIALASIGGPVLGGRRLRVTRETRLRIRTPAERIGELLPLAGKYLDVGGHEISLGVPEVRMLKPDAVLASRLVTLKGHTQPEPFLESVGRQLQALGVAGHASIPVVPGGPWQGSPQRRVVRIKGRLIIGFALVVDGLSEQDSQTLLVHGLGGRRHMGCGLFSPLRRISAVEVSHAV